MYSNTLKFIGASSKIDKPEIGMVKTDGITCSVQTENNWIPITTTATTIASINFSEPRILRPKICACCNAPLKADKCEYCGVEYD